MYAERAIERDRRTRGRRIVVVDIENINGGTVRSEEAAGAAWRDVAATIGLAADEQVVVGVGPSSLLAAAASYPQARFVMGRGLDGADHALLHVLFDERIADRFDEVVIASGDGIFAEAAARLASDGAHVTVVARYGHLSNRLRLAAGDVVLVDEPSPSHGKAA